jgi:hypothetical protein
MFLNPGFLPRFIEPSSEMAAWQRALARLFPAAVSDPQS